MSDFLPALIRVASAMRRPRLLVNAASAGQRNYRRERDLKRIAGLTARAESGHALHRLITEERALEEDRLARAASYAPTRHIEVMIALIAELQLLKTAARPVA